MHTPSKIIVTLDPQAWADGGAKWGFHIQLQWGDPPPRWPHTPGEGRAVGPGRLQACMGTFQHFLQPPLFLTSSLVP